MQEQRAIFGVADSIDPSLDVAYPTTYYPGVTDSSHASPIVIGAGPKEINLRLSAVPALSITFPYTPPQIVPNGQPLTPMPALPQLRISVFGQVQPVNAPTQLGRVPNQGEITGLAPGDYLLSDPRQSISQVNAGTPLHLTESLASGTLPATPELTHLHVLLKTTDGSGVPNGILVGLMHAHSHDFIARVNRSKARPSWMLPRAITTSRSAAGAGDASFARYSPAISLFPPTTFTLPPPVTSTSP
jgi:hypothetical protein